MFKYLFIDIDGTLTNSQKEISKPVLQAIEKMEQKGMQIIFCSGRSNDYLIDLTKRYHCGKYLISSNGTMIYDKDGEKTLYFQKMPYDVIKSIFKYAEERRIGLIFNGETCRYGNIFLKKKNLNKYKIIEVVEDLRDVLISQIVISTDDIKKIEKMSEDIKLFNNCQIAYMSDMINDTHSKNYSCDIINIDNDKGMAIRNFLKMMNASREECVAIGDSINDISMFDSVALKIAMGNACAELKEKADFITKTNDEDGVKYALDYIDDI